MKKLLIAALLAAGPAFAGDWIASQGKDTVRLSEEPCMFSSVLLHIPEANRSEFYRAEAYIGGKRFYACWRPAGSVVHLVYEDADQGAIPVSDLKPAPSI